MYSTLMSQFFKVSSKRFSREWVTNFCTSKSLTAQPEEEQEARNYRAITLNKATDGKITEACWKLTATERFVIKFVRGF